MSKGTLFSYCNNSKGSSEGKELYILPHLHSVREHLCPVRSEGGQEELCHHFL